ncbi:MAG TPA: DNA (cytosine-5-)-methyltransferase [Thermoanaerobaculia bacterium]
MIDLFAGPGGLGEGFSAFSPAASGPAFRIGLSIEKDPTARQTLRLRSFFRQFPQGDVPDAYYRFLRKEVQEQDVYRAFPREAAKADREAWRAELGAEEPAEIDRRVQKVITGSDAWVLIGGPPCQAYSLVGRARRAGDENFERDHRHYLYREYLRILARHQPDVFVMENVKGILSATLDGKHTFQRILSDLQRPEDPDQPSRKRVSYRLYAISCEQVEDGSQPEPSDFLVRCENYGVPQARHRVIVLGVREGSGRAPGVLKRARSVPTIAETIGDLPPLRSQLSGTSNDATSWLAAIARGAEIIKSVRPDKLLHDVLSEALERARGVTDLGAEFVKSSNRPRYRPKWFYDSRIGGACNHSGRRHLAADVQRYFFAATFAAAGNGNARSPRLADFPPQLLPAHANVLQGIEEGKFSDRFRVQVKDHPSTTITSHIAKDGHYYIHYDPSQARSLTVREAARLQTFPDNYFFCGPRTSQYQQVGNAVPPFLAHQIAAIVYSLLA